MLLWNLSWLWWLFNSSRSQHHVAFLIANAFSSSNAWVHALLSDDFIYRVDNEIYLYKMLTTNLLQAMLVRRAEQSHQHQQSSNNALLTRWAHTQSKSEAITTWSSSVLKLAHTQKNSNVFAYILQLIYDIYIYIAKARLSFCTHTDKRDAVNRSVFRIFRSIYTQRNHTQSSNSALFTRWAHIQHTHIYCKDMIQLVCIYTFA